MKDGKWTLFSDSATKYYSESLDEMTTDLNGNQISFTGWVKKYLGSITAKDAVDTNGKVVDDFASDLKDEKIFAIDADKNNPLKSDSVF